MLWVGAGSGAMVVGAPRHATKRSTVTTTRLISTSSIRRVRAKMRVVSKARVLSPILLFASLAATFACPQHADDARPDPIASAKPSAPAPPPPPVPSASASVDPLSCVDPNTILFSLEDARAEELLTVLEQLSSRKRFVHPDAKSRLACATVTIHNSTCVDIEEAFRQSAEALRPKGLVLTKTGKALEVTKAPGPGCEAP